MKLDELYASRTAADTLKGLGQLFTRVATSFISQGSNRKYTHYARHSKKKRVRKKYMKKLHEQMNKYIKERITK